jgi:hypothetical protein
MKLFPPRETLVSDIPVRDGNIDKLFYGVVANLCSRSVCSGGFVGAANYNYNKGRGEQ